MAIFRSVRLFLVTAPLAFLLCACRTGPSAGGQPRDLKGRIVNAGDTLLAGIKRGPCFGKCPQYVAMIYQSGYATYDGERNVSRIGKWESRLDDGPLSLLKSMLKDSGADRWDSAYVNKYLADFPVLFLWISHEGASRRIMINHEAPPEKITGFARELDRLLSGLTWKKVDGDDDSDE